MLMQGKLFALVAFVGLLAGLPGLAAAQEGTADVTPTSSLERTNVRYFVPFGPDGLNPTLEVIQEVEGSCSESSIADVGRPDAWFCQLNAGTILDPCFENTFGAFDEPATLACIDSPFTNQVTLLTTADPLRHEKDGDPSDAGAPIVGADGASAAPEAMPGQAPIDGTDPSGGAISAEVAIDPVSIPWAIELASGERCGLLTGATAAIAGMRINYGCDSGGYIIDEVDRWGNIWTANYYDATSLATELVEIATVWT